MGQKFERMIPLIVAVVCAAVLPMPRAGAQAVSLQEQLVAGINSLGVGPRDLISILQSIKAAGALQADLEVR